MPWFRKLSDDTLRLFIHAQPGAQRSEIAGLHNDALKVRIAAPAADSRANEELVRFLAERFAVPVRAVDLVRGGHSRIKQVDVRGSPVDPDSLLP